jgi:type IV pilus assembly protein PilA
VTQISIRRILGADRTCNGQRGFTLMELLFVMSIMIIPMFIAIPNFISMKAQADETSAIQSLRAIYQTQIQYQTDFPASGFSCSLAALGGNASAGPPTSQVAQVLQGDLATGQKSGYTFNVVNCTKVTVNNQDMYTSYQATAVPQSIGKSGHRGFCIDEAGELKADLAGGTNCSKRFSRATPIYRNF